MISLSSMRTFVAVIEEGSFTQAAERLNATQSGVSQQIAKLERGLGVLLITRGSAGATPTPAGRLLYSRCVAILREASAAEASVRTYSIGATGEVRVGLMPALTRSTLGPVLRRLAAAHPNMRIRAVEAASSDLIPRIRSGELDIAIVPVFDAPDSMRCRAIGSSAEVLVGRGCQHPLHMIPVDLAALGHVKLLLQSVGNIRRQRILAYLRARQVGIATILDLDSMFGTLEYLANSDFVTILPAIMVLPEIENESLCVRPIDDPGFSLDMMLIEPKRRPESDMASLVGDEFERELERQSATIAARIRRRRPRRRKPTPRRHRR